MATATTCALALLLAVAPRMEAETRQVQATVTPRAASATAEGTRFGQVPYVLRIEGLRLPGNHGSRLKIYGQAPSKGAPVLGTAEGMGWEGGPELSPPRNFVIALSQEAARYLVGRRQVKLWVECEGMAELHFLKAVVDVSETK